MYLSQRESTIRFDFNDDYFTDIYQGIPKKGYTNFFENILDHENINNHIKNRLF